MPKIPELQVLYIAAAEAFIIADKACEAARGALDKALAEHYQNRVGTIIKTKSGVDFLVERVTSSAGQIVGRGRLRNATGEWAKRPITLRLNREDGA